MKELINTLFVLVILCVSTECVRSQDDKIFSINPGTSYIQTYGLEDETTIRLIEILISDTNNLVFVDGYGNFLMKSLLMGHYGLQGDNLPRCTEQMKRLTGLVRKENIMGFNNNSVISFPEYFFKATDSAIYHNIMSNFGIRNIDDFKNNDSTTRIKICNKFVDEYDLSQLDSLLLLQKAFGVKPSIESLNILGVNKRIIYLFNNYGMKDELINFITKHDGKENVYFILAKKGSTVIKRGFFSFHNRIKKQTEFSLISPNDLPKMIKISSDEEFSSETMKGFNFIYVSNLSNCAY